MILRILKWVGIALGVAILGLLSFAFVEVRLFDASTTKIYSDVPVPALARSTDPAVIERGKHLAESLGECVLCHGPNLGGGKDEPMGPLGKIVIPNITTGKDGRGALYSDGELARLIRHGVKRSGQTVRLMPANDFGWWPDEDVVAVISWVRAQAPVDGQPAVFEVGAFAKILDRFDSIPIDVARRINHAHLPEAPPPSPDAVYGAFVGTACRGCHGEHLSGGPIPGAPPDLPVPLNITSHETGLQQWSYEDFKQAFKTGVRKNGKPFAAFMPVESFRNLNDVESRALWAYLRSVPPRPFGQR